MTALWAIALVVSIFLISEAYVQVHTHKVDDEIKVEIEKLKTEISALKMKSTFG